MQAVYCRVVISIIEKKSRKKGSFLSGSTTKALTPHPLELRGHTFFRIFLKLQQKFFFLSEIEISTNTSVMYVA